MAGCPICGLPMAQSCRPFCSRRCADVDLARWLRGDYFIASGAEEEEPAPAQDIPGHKE
ncbi:MAG: DNA gyrase inhibitor YacG [Paracoccus sp. (in: a-proteobacteria)]|nr:DNA gyrase inhibitor YacG [Paracoccus sp. (in: a-proteobacteria)]